MDTENHTGVAYILIAPALLVIILTGAIPLAMVVNYSLQDSFAGNQFFWVGADWYQSVLKSPEFVAALGRSIGFSMMVLAIEIPLGIFIALRMPAKGALATFYVVMMAIPLLTPWLVVGYVWKILILPQLGLLGSLAAWAGFTYDMGNPLVAWATLGLMDAWHWTSLVVLLCYAGLQAIPYEYYQAAKIDGASGWRVFWYVQLPKIRLVLLIAILLRFIDSFMIYTEAYVLTGGGPGVSTTFLSRELVQTATIQFDLGEGGAMSVIYFLIVLAISWVFFTLVKPRESVARGEVLR